MAKDVVSQGFSVNLGAASSGKNFTFPQTMGSYDAWSTACREFCIQQVLPNEEKHLSATQASPMSSDILLSLVDWGKLLQNKIIPRRPSDCWLMAVPPNRPTLQTILKFIHIGLMREEPSRKAHVHADPSDPDMEAELSETSEPEDEFLHYHYDLSRLLGVLRNYFLFQSALKSQFSNSVHSTIALLLALERSLVGMDNKDVLVDNLINLVCTGQDVKVASLLKKLSVSSLAYLESVLPNAVMWEKRFNDTTVTQDNPAFAQNDLLKIWWIRPCPVYDCIVVTVPDDDLDDES